MRKFIFSCIILSQIITTIAMADDWPKRPIKLTVAYGAGGTTDSTARLLASIIEKDLGQEVTVLNKPGGGGSVSATLAKTQRPDGYNIFTFVTGAAVISPHLQHIPYDPLKDFTPIARYAGWNLGIVVRKDSPFNTLAELLEYAKENSGKISYSIAGTGTPQHLTMERLGKKLGIQWKALPYKGGAASVTALLGGHVDLMAGATEWLPQVRSGEFKLLAVITDKRMAEFPEVPTLIDLGYGISAPTLLGIAGPKGIPTEIVEKLSAAIEKATKAPRLIALVDKLAMQMGYLNAEEFAALIESEYHIQGDVIKKAGMMKK